MAKDKMFVIDDDTSSDLLYFAHLGRGLDLTGRPEGFAYAGTADPFPDELLISSSDYQAIIEENTAKKTRLVDAIDQAGLPVKDQKQTNFCWANAPTHCTEIMIVKAGQPKVVLSAASVACPVNGFRNAGGWGKTALQQISNVGVVPDANWPNTAISRQYDTAETKALAGNYRCTEWWALDNRNVNQVASCVLRGFPVAIGLNWWSHEVTVVDVVWQSGTIAWVIDNSWGPSWGTNGRGILQGNRMVPDDAVSARVIMAS